MFSHAVFWWLITGLLVLLELATGTFFLLMLALGAALGAVAAHAGFQPVGQMVTAALAGGGAVTVWFIRRKQHGADTDVQTNPDALLDIGQEVQVDSWNPDRTTRIPYRGSSWQARLADSGLPLPGPHTIVRIEGSVLLLARRNKED